MQQTITWTFVDLDLCLHMHMASLGINAQIWEQLVNRLSKQPIYRGQN